MTEEWRETRYPGFFVSSLGRVRGRRGGILKQRLNDGYPHVKMSIYGYRKVHQLVCEGWNGTRPPEAIVRHLDGNRLNNLPENLRWGTVAENAADTRAHGTLNGPANGMFGKKGILNPNSKLTQKKADEIRKAYADKEGSQLMLAKQFGIGQTHVSRIIRGQLW
jgi:HNH endonuclease